METSIQKHFHTKRQCDMFLVVLGAKVERPQFEQFRSQCKELGGWYSRQWGGIPGGFAFYSEATAQEFATAISGTEAQIVAGSDWADLWKRATAAGHKAGQECEPVPMHIKGYAPIADGMCGFAWISIFPARGGFVSWLKSQNIGSKGYPKGWQIWVSGFNQSHARKEAFANAAAAVLREAGIKAYGGSRLD